MDVITIDRSRVLQAAVLCPLPHFAPAYATAKPDHTVRIAKELVELAPDQIVSTTLYNGQFPGPLLRFKEGQRTTVDPINETDTPELPHRHGQQVASDPVIVVSRDPALEVTAFSG